MLHLLALAHELPALLQCQRDASYVSFREERGSMPMSGDPMHLQNLEAFSNTMPFATPLDMLGWYWGMVPEDTLVDFLIQRLTPSMRQALATGLDAKADAGPDLFRYALGARVRLAGEGRGTVLQRRRTERGMFAPVLEYLVGEDAVTAWWYETDIVGDEDAPCAP